MIQEKGVQRNMRWKAVLILGVTCIICQVVAKVPPKEDMCGMIVDAEVKQQCLRCFKEAGHISQNPEEVRKCTATYLPPDLAECSVPHVEKPDTVRINQGGGEYHNNHTNANYLPSCLKRRLRKLVDYQKREERFVRQASGGVQYIVESTLIKHGGPTMLSIQAMTSIMQLPDVKNLVEASASHCQEKYGQERKDLWEGNLLEAQRHGLVWEDLIEEEDKEEQLKDVYDVEEGNASLKEFPKAAAGNNLPFEGTNSLARKVLLYECITSALFDSGAGGQLLEVVMQDGFFTPIPEWWVKPLLMTAKSASQ